MRSYVAAPTQITASTLLTSLYSVWNADTTGTSLDSSIYGVWNGEILSSVTTLNTNLVSFWNANGNTNDSVGSNNGVSQGSLTYSVGKIGNAFTFNGNSYIQLTDNSLNVTGTHSFSLSSWIYITSASTYQSIVGAWEWQNTGTAYGWGLRLSPYNSTKMNVEFFTDWQGGTANPDFLQASNSISLNTWIHVLVTRNGSTGVEKVYVNGSQVATRTKSVSFIASTRTITPTIGAEKYNSTSVSTYMSNGSKIDSVSFWRKELSISEVSALYNSGNSIESPYPASIDTYIQSPNDSFGTNHGTLVNGVVYSTGKLGSAFSFDGVNDYVTLPSDTLAFTSDFSVSVWVNATTLSTEKHIIGNVHKVGGTSGQWKGWHLFVYNNKLYFRIYNNGANSDVIQTSTFTTGNWYHIVLTKSGSTQKMYINGVNESTNNSALTPNYSSPNFPTIGISYYYTGTGWPLEYCWSGRIDAATIWTKAISPDEVVQLYNAGNGTQYPFSTQTLTSAGNQFAVDNGTLMNGTTFTDGKVGKAFTFDGINDYVSLPNNSLNLTGDFSIGLWVYFNSLNQPNSQWNQQFIFSNNPIGLGNGFSLYKHSNNSLYFIISNGSSTSFFRAPQTLLQSTWYHVVITRKFGTTTKIYINGTEQTDASYYSGNSSINPTYLTNQVVNLSGWGNAGGDLLNGKIDTFNVWQKELTGAEVTELYNTGNGKQLTVDTKILTNGLVLNLDPSRTSSYPNTGTTWYDISGNSRNMNLVNGVSYATASNGIMTFDGVNDYASVSPINTGNIFTIQVWAKISRFGGGNGGWNRATLVANSYLYSGNNGFFFFGTSQNNTNGFMATPGYETFAIVFGQDQYGAGAANGSLTQYVNKWVNLSVVVNAGNPIRLYINGVEVQYSGQGNGPATSTTINYANNFIVGSRILDNTDFLQGSIGSVYMYNRALSATELLQNFNATKSRFGL